MENTNKNQKSEIHLIRHSITEGNQKRWFYGKLDIPLEQEGINLVKELVSQEIYPCLGNLKYDTDFYTSGMLRAEQTFELIYGKTSRKVIDNLREINFGVFEGFSHDELKDRPDYIAWLNARSDKIGPAEGECVADFRARVRHGFDELVGYHRLKELSHRHSKKEAHSVAVCHGGVIGILMMSLFAEEEKHMYQWIPDPAHGYTLTMQNGKPTAYKQF